MAGYWVQNIVVALLVVGCVFVVGRKAWRSLAGKGGGSCGCENCPASEGSSKTQKTQKSKQPTTIFNPLSNIDLKKSNTSDKTKIRLLG